jgi:hypothetical protein
MTQLNEMIGLCIENDCDIASFAGVCAATASSIYGNERHYWRLRFQQKFDAPISPYKSNVYTNNGMYQLVYCRYRYSAFRKSANIFKNGTTEEEEMVLREIVQTLNGQSFLVLYYTITPLSQVSVGGCQLLTFQ